MHAPPDPEADRRQDHQQRAGNNEAVGGEQTSNRRGAVRPIGVDVSHVPQNTYALEPATWNDARTVLKAARQECPAHKSQSVISRGPYSP